MAIKYEIARWHSQFYDKAASYETCSRADKAASILWDEVRTMLASEGLLDRPVALRLVKEMMDCEIAPPKPGYYRSQTFYLRPDKKGYSAFVEFTARRV